MKEKAKLFFKEYKELCEKHNFSLACGIDSNDCPGFILQPYYDENIDLAKYAIIDEYGDCVNWELEKQELDRLIELKDLLTDNLFNLIGGEGQLCLADNDIFDLVKGVIIRPATEEEIIMKNTINLLNLKIQNFIVL